MTLKTGIEAFLAVAFWGASFVATKIALAEVTPLTVVALRFALGLATIAVVLAFRHQVRAPEPRDLGWLVLLGLNGITVHQLLQANGLVTTTATNSAWIVALIPIFTAILARLVVHERFGPLKVLGLAMATLGTLVIVGRGAVFTGVFRNATPGDLLLLLSAVNWALFTALSKRVMEHYPPGLLIAFIMAFGWLMTLPLAAAEGEWQHAAGMSPSAWASIAFLGVFCSGLAYVFWYDALAETDASALASFIYIEPLVTSFLAATLIGEAITWPVVVGGSTILLGVWLVNRRGPRISPVSLQQ
jgi:drug/metabolite transporter (DMT)-like permease